MKAAEGTIIKIYPCGCCVTGAKGTPDYCPEHGEPPPPRFSVSDLFGDQAEDSETVAAITAIVREADHAFETSGGSSRHWVRDQFLPRLNAHGWRVLSPGRPVVEQPESVPAGATPSEKGAPESAHDSSSSLEPM